MVTNRSVPLQRVFLACFAIALAGCAAPEKIKGDLRYGMLASREGARIEFPPPPDIPRFAYAGELIGEQNFVYDRPEKTGWEKFLAILAGAGDDPMSPVELARPQAVATDGEGRVFVSDAALGGVFVFDVVEGEARILRTAESGVPFRSPAGMAPLPDGTLLVSDADGGFVARIAASGKTYPAFGRGVLRRPAGVIYDPSQQRVVVSDVDDSVLYVFDLEGRLITTIGRFGSAPGEFNRPTYMAIWKNELYVSDTFNSRIQVLDLDTGSPIRVIGSRGIYVGQLSIPKGVALDSEGNVYVIESRHDHLLVFDRQGRFLLPIGGTGYTTGNFYLPAGIWIDPGNRIYVADMYNGRVVTYLYLGGEEESD